jgi:hypothetical protein
MIDRTARLSATEFAKTHFKTPALVEHGIRCGKANCKCRGDYRHGPYGYKYWRDLFGTAHRVYVPKAEVEAVREIIERRQWIERERRQLLEDSRAYLRLVRAYLR